MPDPVACQKCGQPADSGSPAGLCPACLMLAVKNFNQVDSPTHTHPTPSDGLNRFIPPTAEQLAHYFPHLELIKVLGHGGMGAVYLARQKSLDRLVAIKIIRPESAGIQIFSDRFSREARALARLNHPNIVGVYDFGSVETEPNPEMAKQVPDSQHLPTSRLFFLLMEYVDGASLRQLIADKTLTPKAALAIVPQICEALQFAHDMDVVHRDIKPENILLDQRGRVKIADFGLAKLMNSDSTDHSLTGTNQVMGTLRYMAPEQLERSRSIDHRADIYSLGVVFYEMLTGELPIGVFEPPSRKVDIDVRLDEVVMRSLAKEPERRYQHASDVKTDIELVSTPNSRPEYQSENELALVTVSDNNDARFDEIIDLPATALKLVGWLGLLMLITILAVPFVSIFFFATDENVAYNWRWYFISLVPAAIQLTLTAGIVAVASTRMRLLLSYRLALVSCVLIMVPVSLLAVAGIPVGLWVLRVLGRKDVKQAFSLKTTTVNSTRSSLHWAGKLLWISAVVSIFSWAVFALFAMFSNFVETRASDSIVFEILWLLAVFSVPFFLGSIHIFAAAKLLNQSSWRWGYAAAILGLIPYSPAWLISFPSAIYALAVLSQKTDGVQRNSELFIDGRSKNVA